MYLINLNLFILFRFFTALALRPMAARKCIQNQYQFRFHVLISKDNYTYEYEYFRMYLYTAQKILERCRESAKV